MNLQTLLDHPPDLHQLDRRRLVNWGVPRELILWLEREVPAGAHTLETGAGLSTLFFAMQGARHIAIAPDAGLMQRIRNWCAQNGVDAERLDLRAEPSETCLPTLQCEPLDLALIDGRHGFPAPFIDWYYIDPLLKVGGLLVVDDTQIWTGAVLRDFLVADARWEFVQEIEAKTAIFRKVGEGSSRRDWYDQPFVIERSTPRLRQRMSAAVRLMRQGRWVELWQRARDWWRR